MKLTSLLIKEIASDILDGLNIKDACKVNGITPQTFRNWISRAETARDKDELTDKDKLYIEFDDVIAKTKLKRKRNLIATLQNHEKSVTGIIFLLKNLYPFEFNKEVHKVLNFDALEKYMQENYTQQEIDRIREAVFAAEDRREQETQYDEDDLFAKEEVDVQ